MGERSVTSIPVDKFRSGVDHFDTWIKYFEDAIDITHAGADAASKLLFLKKWLPFKLDDKARLVYSGVPDGDWAAIKANFKEALKDPQEEYNWYARRVTIVWDGVESFQSLETRIKRAVDLYETDGKDREYFYRFRMALPKDYRRAIDIGCEKENRTIAKARAIAERVRLADAEDAEEPTPGTAASLQPSKSVSFTGAAMAEDRLKSLEMAVQGIAVRMEGLELKKSKDEEPKSRDESSSRGRYETRYQDRRSESRGSSGRYDRRDSYDRRSRDDSRDRRSDRRDRDRYRAYSGERSDRERSRRDSFDRRDYDRRRSGRWGSRQDSYDRRRSYASPAYSRDRRYSRDRDESYDRSRRYEDRDRDYSRSQRFDSRERHDRDQDQYDRSGAKPEGSWRDGSRRDYGDRQSRKRDESEHRLAEFNSQVDWLCAVLDEKQKRDRDKPQEN